MTDHILFVSYDPLQGWSAPEIRPYGPIAFDPASSCFQYATSAFEGMKACNVSLHIRNNQLTTLQ